MLNGILSKPYLPVTQRNLLRKIQRIYGKLFHKQTVETYEFQIRISFGSVSHKQTLLRKDSLKLNPHVPYRATTPFMELHI